MRVACPYGVCGLPLRRVRRAEQVRAEFCSGACRNAPVKNEAKHFDFRLIVLTFVR